MNLTPVACRRIRCHQGLTLMEVIVAMTVLAFGVAMVLGAISACLRSSDASATYSRGALLAQQVATELERNETLDPDTLTGTFDDASSGYAWTAVIAPADENGLYPVHITVTWENSRRKFELFTSLRPHPLPTPAPAVQPTDNTPETNQPVTPDGPTGPTNGRGRAARGRTAK